MGTHTAFFVRSATDRDDVFERVVAWLGDRRGTLAGAYSVRTWAQSPWVEVSHADFALGGVALGELSRSLKLEIVRVAAQTGVDHFGYQHFHSGRQLRRLEYAGETDAGWLHIEGEAEAWEETAFFDDELLAELLDTAETDAAKQVVGAAFQRRDLAWTAGHGAISAAAASAAVAQHWCLPGFSDDQPTASLVVRGTKGRHGDMLSWSLLALGSVAVAVDGSMHARLSGVGGIGFLATWAGSAIRMRRSSSVIALGGGLLFAVSWLLVPWFVGKAF